MNILICDDNEQDIEIISKRIKTFFEEIGIDYSLAICHTSKYIFEHIRELDVIFLDIELAQENGIDIGLKVRKMRSDVKIIITSNYSKYLIDGYSLHADRYFIKPIKKSHFDSDFAAVMYRYLYEFEGFRDEKIQLEKIYFKDILYIEFIDRKSYIYLKNEKVLTVSYPLKYWHKLLKGKTFAQSHRSFIVNLFNLDRFDKENVYFHNGSSVPISRHYKEEFESEYLNSLHRLM